MLLSWPAARVSGDTARRPLARGAWTHADVAAAFDDVMIIHSMAVP
jgi:hypothetical protein